MITRNELLQMRIDGKITEEQRYQFSWLADEGFDVSKAVKKPISSNRIIAEICNRIKNNEDFSDLIK